MKTLLTILITLCFVSFTKAQNSIPKNLFDEEFNYGVPDTSLKLQMPDLILKSPSADSGLTYKLPGSDFQLKENESSLYGNNYYSEFRMPVAGGQSNSKMPVMVPDSTVNYTLKIKEIPFVNPLFKNQGIRPEDIEKGLLPE